jgi:arsenate reductase (thioredoxin)
MKFLFICTHNRCRSILAEAVCNYYSDGLIEAVSAGSNPAEQVHPLTLRALKALKISTENLSSESWDAYEDADIDYVITVCDKAAKETCPVWFGNTRQVHWGLLDPSTVEGDPEAINAAFIKTITILKRRIKQIKSWIRQGIEEDELFNRIKALADQQ